MVYKANQISTIVDVNPEPVFARVYKANQISTIVDIVKKPVRHMGL